MWPQNAVAITNLLSMFTLAGSTVYYYGATLGTGATWYYRYSDALPFAAAVAWYDAYANFPAPGIGGFHQGESFNYVVRPQLKDKLTLSDLIVYVGTH